jgi:uncharacterized membrane protein (DUF4010 family)
VGDQLDLLVFRNFAIALAIGALVGLEREKKKELEGDIGVGGLRTFILIAMTGAVGGWMSQVVGSPWILVAALLAVAAGVVAGYVVQGLRNPRFYGMTTEVAAVVVCLLGSACMLGYPEVAIALGIATSAVLAFKEPLHRLVARIGTEDIYAGVKLLIASFIVLPLLPDRTVDPWGAINPYKLWLLVVLISAISLVGYVAVRWLGPGRGTAVTGLAGGIVSSTAVTLTFAKQSRSEPHEASTLSLGILIAWLVMAVRIVVLVAIVDVTLVPTILPPLVGAAVATLAMAGLAWRQSVTEATAHPQEVPLKNPFSLTEAIKFALFFAAVLLVVRLVELYAPGRGFYAVAALAGLTDVDAITLSMTRYAGESGDARTAALAIAIGALSNTLVKGGYVVALGAPALRRRIVVATAVIAAAVVIGMLLVR